MPSPPYGLPSESGRPAPEWETGPGLGFLAPVCPDIAE